MNRYALVDKRGKNRGTCSAKHFAAAEKAFVKQRGGKAIPDGWGVELRGGVEKKAASEKFIGEVRLPKARATVDVMNLPQLRDLLGEARQTIKEQAEKIAAVVKNEGRLQNTVAELQHRLEVKADAYARLSAACASLEERVQDRRELATQIADIKALLRSWEIQGATTVTAMVYGLKKVLDRKD